MSMDVLLALYSDHLILQGMSDLFVKEGRVYLDLKDILILDLISNGNVPMY